MTEIQNIEDKQSMEQPFEYASGPEDSGIWFWREDKAALIPAGIIALCVAGLLLLLAIPLLAVLQNVLGVNLPGVNAVVQWLAAGSKGLILAVALAVIAALSFLYLRYRLRHNAQLYTGAGCPQCKEQELMRVRRQRSDRVIAFLGIPVRRYVCRNCSWDGLRIGGPVPGAESDLEVIPADLLLANDVVIQQSETAVRESS